MAVKIGKGVPLPPEPASPVLYTLRQSAAYFNMPLPSFHATIRRHLPAVRLGPRTVRFRRADLDAFIESRMESADE